MDALLSSLSALPPVTPSSQSPDPVSTDAEWSRLPRRPVSFWSLRGCNYRLSDAEIDCVFRDTSLNPTDAYIEPENRHHLRRLIRRYGDILQHLSNLADTTANLEATASVQAGHVTRSQDVPRLGSGTVTIVHTVDKGTYAVTADNTPLALAVLDARSFVRQQLSFEVMEFMSAIVPLDTTAATGQFAATVGDTFLTPHHTR